jgi:hypothetical protein
MLHEASVLAREVYLFFILFYLFAKLLFNRYFDIVTIYTISKVSIV